MTRYEITDFGARLGDLELIWAKNSEEFFFSNTLYLRGPQGIVIDPSANLTYLERRASAREVAIVLNTHYHLDHRALNGLFRGVSFACHELDAPAMESHETFQSSMDADTHSPYSLWAQGMAKALHIGEVEIDKKLRDGDVLSSGSQQLRCVHLPGHTPGHLGLYFEESRLLYVADIDLTPFGPWYAGACSDIDQFLKSLERVRTFQEEGAFPQYYATSHGDRLYEREEFLVKLEKFEAKFSEREQKIMECLSHSNPDGITAEEINEKSPIYRSASRMSPLKNYFSLKMIQKHLDHLEAKHLVRHQTERQGAGYCLA